MNWLAKHATAFRAQDVRSISAWACQHVEPPNSARASKLDVSVTPWLREPLDFSADNRVKEMVCLMPTGAGKTTLFDAIIPHSICEDPGGILLVLQTDPDAKEYVEERLMPILRKVEPVSNILSAMDRHSIRKEAVIFPHMPLYMGGANLTNLQRKSVRRVLGDEVWRWKHGYVKEARARTHDRWNQRVILVSQGGVTHIFTDQGMIQTELEDAWKSTDQREWHFECPECKTVQRFRFKALRYETVEKEDGTLDETGIFQSATYSCLGRCETNFTDIVQNRRTLAMSGSYVAGNSRHLPGKHGWHCNALTLHYLPWGTIAVELAKAHFARKRGDEEPIKIFRQKRGAENYREEEATPPGALTSADYSLLDYAKGELWEGEAKRFLTVDVQQGYFICIVRAWRPDGSSRLIYEGRISTWEGVRELQTQYGVGDWMVGVCNGYNIDDEVLIHCGQWKWFALNGDKGDRYPWFPKRGPAEYRFYSTVKNERGSTGAIAKMVTWSNRQIKRILERFRDGRRQAHEIARDTSDDYRNSMFSEVEKDVLNKKTKRVERRFVKIGNRQNHKWDAECEQIVMALIHYILADRPSASTKAEPEAGEAVEAETQAA